MDIITGALNNDVMVNSDVIYLDFIKAFDRVAHTRFAIKLKWVGITGNLLSWCISFLSFCKKRVIMGSNVGECWMTIQSGVPQVSVLGEQFTLYIL